MVRDFARLTSCRYDLLIIGGGIHGLAAAYDAAQRGLSVALVERGDFASGASSNHLKTVHGGLRYLQSGDLPRVRESIRERTALARMAPHLLTPLPYLMPTSRKLTRSRAALGAAFVVDAVIGHDRNRGVPPALHLPAGRLVSKAECLRLFPDVPAPGVTGGALWYDYQMRDPDRLTLLFAVAADLHGACLANYVEALEPVIEGGRVTGVPIRDTLTGTPGVVDARLILNAAGAAAVPLLRRLGGRDDIPLIKAMNIVTSQPMQGPSLSSSTRSGRLLFMVPWLGRAMVGTSHAERPCAPGDVSVSTGELDAFLEDVNQAFPARHLQRADVMLVHRGVVPAVRGRDGRLDLEGHHRLLDHADDGVQGAVSLVGAKYTTGRRIAELAVDLVMAKLQKAGVTGRTALEPLPGGNIPDPAAAIETARGQHASRLDGDIVAHLVETYGTHYPALVSLALADSALAARLAPPRPVVGAQVVHAIRAEMACTLSDVILRRTALGSAGYPGEAAVASVVALMRKELGWSDARCAQEVTTLREFYAPVLVG